MISRNFLESIIFITHNSNIVNGSEIPLVCNAYRYGHLNVCFLLEICHFEFNLAWAFNTNLKHPHKNFEKWLKKIEVCPIILRLKVIN